MSQSSVEIKSDFMQSLPLQWGRASSGVRNSEKLTTPMYIRQSLPIRIPELPSADETDINDEELDQGLRRITIRSLDTAAMKSLNNRPSRMSLLRKAIVPVKEDPFEDADCADDMEEGIANIGKSAHRCSMIKKYTTAFFTPA